MRKNYLWLVLVAICWLSFEACSDDDNKSASGTPYDPSKPVEFSNFMPDSGGIRTKFVIEGSNFGNDISKVKVIFDSTRNATIVAMNSNTIYCITPKQAAKANTVAVVVENDTVYSDKKFSYKVVERSSLIAGKFCVGEYVNGTLAESRFNRPEALAYIGDNTLLVFEHDDGNMASGKIRLVSIDENQVAEIERGKAYSMPAVSKDMNTVYAVSGGKSDHILYRFQRASLWLPEKLGKIYDLSTSRQAWGCALDGNEEYLYVTDEDCNLVKINVKDKRLITREDQELLNDDLGLEKADGSRCCLCYNPVANCFFATSSKKHGVIKVNLDGTTELYAGFNSVGNQDGYLLEATFSQPVGICADSEGNMYVSDSGTHVIRKINYRTGYVSTVCGVPGSAGNSSSTVDGDPLTVYFNWPYAVVCDDEDNVYIGERWGCDIRKYAIE